MTFSYDEDSDVLYITFIHSASEAVRYLETDRGDVLRFCEQTHQIVGVTILYFAERSRKGEPIEIPEAGPVAFSSLMAAILAEPRGKNANPGRLTYPEGSSPELSLPS